jgi:thiol-disulfide isomerase/thioredoxin
MRRLFPALAVASAMMLWGGERVRSAGPPTSPIGRKIDGFKLHGVGGAVYDFAESKESEFLVVSFLGTECPLAKLYGPRLAELHSQYATKKVAFVAIDANEQDTLAEMAQYARVSKIEFPFLKDAGNLVADVFGAARTPQVFVLNKDRMICYAGRIDDQFEIGIQRQEPKRKDLAIALDELLAGKQVSVPVTPSIGCHIGRVNRTTPHGEITYSKNIAALVQKHCVACHRPGEIAPFALTSYEDVVNWSATIREVVQEKRMPPWHAESDAGHFVNDRRFPEHDQKLLFDWIDNGMPIGNAAEVPALPKFLEGWEIPKPDLIVQMPAPYTVPAKGTVEYQYFELDQKIPEDKWVVAAEARPGNHAVVHHLLLFYVPPGYDRPVQQASLVNSVATFAPGMPAWQARPGMAKRIPAGSKLYFQVHYTPNGIESTDLSRAGLVFADAKQVAKQVQTDAAVNFRLRIPPKANNARFEADHRFPRDMQLVSLLPHMHLRGRAFRIESINPAGERKLLLDVPRYDFNWQNSYVFSEPVVMREGTTLHCIGWYDNSDDNPSNPDSSQTVGWGDQTWEEMLVAQFEAVLDNQDLRLGLPKVTLKSGDDYEVEFTYRPAAKAEFVVLAGEFNGWKPDGHKMEGPDKTGTYKTRITLKPGVHQYKFVIDGKAWRNDPGNSEVAGDYANSVLRIVSDKVTTTPKGS